MSYSHVFCVHYVGKKPHGYFGECGYPIEFEHLRSHFYLGRYVSGLKMYSS